jgi:hypothetical protein
MNFFNQNIKMKSYSWDQYDFKTIKDFISQMTLTLGYFVCWSRNDNIISSIYFSVFDDENVKSGHIFNYVSGLSKLKGVPFIDVRYFLKEPKSFYDFIDEFGRLLYEKYLCKVKFQSKKMEISDKIDQDFWTSFTYINSRHHQLWKKRCKNIILFFKHINHGSGTEPILFVQLFYKFLQYCKSFVYYFTHVRIYNYTPRFQLIKYNFRNVDRYCNSHGKRNSTVMFFSNTLYDRAVKAYISDINGVNLSLIKQDPSYLIEFYGSASDWLDIDPYDVSRYQAQYFAPYLKDIFDELLNARNASVALYDLIQSFIISIICSETTYMLIENFSYDGLIVNKCLHAEYDTTYNLFYKFRHFDICENAKLIRYLRNLMLYGLELPKDIIKNIFSYLPDDQVDFSFKYIPKSYYQSIIYRSYDWNINAKNYIMERLKSFFVYRSSAFLTFWRKHINLYMFNNMIYPEDFNNIKFYNHVKKIFKRYMEFYFDRMFGRKLYKFNLIDHGQIFRTYDGKRKDDLLLNKIGLITYWADYFPLNDDSFHNNIVNSIDQALTCQVTSVLLIDYIC